ncbi:hypothetical protein FOL47_004030, partial [Perkinsus chesapeaki]
GPLYKWDNEDQVLLAIDPCEEEPSWRKVLVTPRSKMSLQRAISKMRVEGYWWPAQVSETGRFIKTCKTCQLDWMGPFAPTNQNDPCPIYAECTQMYYCVMICEATKWIATYGPPSTLHIDNAGAHHNTDELLPFFNYWDIEARYGVPRRPESQGLVERSIRDLKDSIRMATSCRGSSTLPWWMAIQIATIIHNSSMRPGIVPCSPNELALGVADDKVERFGITDAGHIETPTDLWENVHNYVTELFKAYQLEASE